uniref:Annexin n=1 Tax=Hyaloperonospora arabidopsidis (strain Emoy2) TaxID=559515 RepID=M4BHL2_HYAAE
MTLELYPSSVHDAFQGVEIPYSPHVVKCAQQIHEACKGPSFDQETLLSDLGSQSLEMRHVIALCYKELYCQSLQSAFQKNETSDEALVRLLRLLATPLPELEAQILSAATKDTKGAPATLLLQVIADRTNEEMSILKNVYYDLVGQDVAVTMDSELSGDFRKVVLARLQAPQVPYNPAVHTAAKAEEEAVALYKAGQGRLGTKEEVFVGILVKAPPEFLKMMDTVYVAQYRNDIAKAVDKEFSGDAKRGLKYLVQCTMNPYPAIAEVFEQTLKACGTDKTGLSTALVRYQSVLPYVKAAYKKLYRKELRDRIGEETSGDYKKLVLSVFDAPRDHSKTKMKGSSWSASSGGLSGRTLTGANSSDSMRHISSSTSLRLSSKDHGATFGALPAEKQASGESQSSLDECVVRDAAPHQDLHHLPSSESGRHSSQTITSEHGVQLQDENSRSHVKMPGLRTSGYPSSQQRPLHLPRQEQKGQRLVQQQHHQQDEEQEQREEQQLRQRQEEEKKKRAKEQQLRQRQEEEQRQRDEEQQLLQRQEEEEQQRAEEEQQQRQKEEEHRQREEEELLQRQEVEQRQRAEAELRKRQEEELRKRQEEELRKRQEEELRQRQEEELRQRQEEELRQRQEEEERQRAEKELRQRQEEEQRQRAEAELRQREEEEQRQRDEEKLQQRLEKEQRQQVEEEEQQRQEEEQRQRAEAELRQLQVEEQRQRDEEKQRKRDEEELQQRRQEEKRQLQQEHLRQRQEEERQQEQLRQRLEEKRRQKQQRMEEEQRKRDEEQQQLLQQRSGALPSRQQEAVHSMQQVQQQDYSQSLSYAQQSQQSGFPPQQQPYQTGYPQVPQQSIDPLQHQPSYPPQQHESSYPQPSTPGYTPQQRPSLPLQQPIYPSQRQQIYPSLHSIYPQQQQSTYPPQQQPSYSLCRSSYVSQESYTSSQQSNYPSSQHGYSSPQLPAYPQTQHPGYQPNQAYQQYPPTGQQPLNQSYQQYSSPGPSGYQGPHGVTPSYPMPLGGNYARGGYPTGGERQVQYPVPGGYPPHGGV